MKIYALSDLHLSHAETKPMDIFGEVWINHMDIIVDHWVKIIREEDRVLIPGDISWAMRMDKARIDLDMLEDLPGYKICIRGNHDYWWDRPGKLNAQYNKLYFLQNKAYMIDKLAICGSRGWICAGSVNFNEEDERILDRELIRLRLSLDDAIKNQAKEIIVMLHYPPTNNADRLSPFISLFKEYPVCHVVYGHLHDETSWQGALQGMNEGIRYDLVSADYLKFIPKLIRA
ncbi:metallophosphoesterase [Cellulosilyticum sp. I15G10I2]|uniref:metallophosphoesterase n=1 Tax=Cellulosilyticum sp. I15G10I2 TaxID=1892843 RepID=UPI00085CBAE1|nr:metallophosphoesterase [Cellulosilyticum sp. I15G10I2]